MKKKILSCLLAVILLVGLSPTTALATDDVAALTEKSVSVASWDELQAAINGLRDNEYLNANITGSLDANSKLDIAGKTVILSAAAENISITRTLQSEANSTDSIFTLSIVLLCWILQKEKRAED